MNPPQTQASTTTSYQVNQPVLAVQPAQQGAVAVEIQVLAPPRRSNIPIIQILATLLPGRVDDPRILFREALQQGYAAALQQARRTASPTVDTVQIQIRHEGIMSNGNLWGTPSMYVAEALTELVTRWEAAMQSGDMVDLSLGALEMYLTFTFYSRGPLANENNENPRMGARAGTYQRLKKKMYYPNINNDWYTSTNALKKVPFTNENMCFPMAFLYSQCRRLTFDPETMSRVVDVQETKMRGGDRHNVEQYLLTRTQFPDLPYQYLEISEEEYHYFHLHLPHLVVHEEPGPPYWLVLFYPYRRKGSNRSQSNQCFQFEDWDPGFHRNSWVQAWLRAATLLHRHVQRTLQREVDATDFNDCCQCYADVFQVHLHILKVETLMNQTHFFRPQTRPWLHGSQDHIYVLFGDADGNYDHCHAITHRRRLCRSIWLPATKQCGVYNYCDYCLKSFPTLQNHEQGCIHLTQCFQKRYYQPLQLHGYHQGEQLPMDQFYENQVKQPTIYQFFPVRKRGRNEEDMVMCRLCKSKILATLRKDHMCFIPLPKPFPEEAPGVDMMELNEKHRLFVYDIETMQNAVVNAEGEISMERYLHRCNCVCVREVYGPYRRTFATMDSFCEELLGNPCFLGSILLAHNGGSFDHQFVVYYLEKHCLPYQAIPRPGGIHKYLSIRITRDNDELDIQLKDFMMFFPGSLKSIAESFKLPIQKGDFPHLFNREENESYEGRIPLLESPEDYYCLRQKKQEKEIQEMKKWYDDECQIYCCCDEGFLELTNGLRSPTCQRCQKKRWIFREQLEKYCWLDVDVLSMCVEKFRTAHLDFGKEMGTLEGGGWKPSCIDPFQMVTQAQVALSFFLRGHRDTQMKPAISQPRTRAGWSEISLMWLEEEQQRMRNQLGNSDFSIQHVGNSFHEYFDTRATCSYVDGYAFWGGREIIYEFLGCFWHGCPYCFHEEVQEKPETIHPRRYLPWGIIYEKTQRKIDSLRAVYPEVHVMWECEYTNRSAPYRRLPSQYEKRLCKNLIQDREFFFGGRTEVFRPYSRGISLQHIDVTSMYPYICSHKTVPFGHPDILFGGTCDKERLQARHPDRYFGYIRCFVVPNPRCVLGLLPSRCETAKGGTERLVFSLVPQEGTWFSEELYLAMENGYEVTELYEVYHFPEDRRTDKYFRGYMSFFLRIKQEAEGWVKAGATSENPTEEEKDQVIENLYVQNGRMARMRKENVRVDPVLRALAKLYLNSLWGKLAQDVEQVNSTILGDYTSWMKEIVLNPEVDRSSLRYRQMPGAAFMCYFQKFKEHKRLSPQVNIWMAASVTAWARTILHRKMIEIGPHRILYCDTDSIVFEGGLENHVQRGLGQWASETDRGEKIKEFYGVAPKCYMKLIEVEDQTEMVKHIKCKGVRMTLLNQQKVTPDIVRSLLEQCYGLHGAENPTEEEQEREQETDYISLDHMTIFKNTTNAAYDYGLIFTLYTKKKFRAVLEKRKKLEVPENIRRQWNFPSMQVHQLYTIPFGFDETYIKELQTQYYQNDHNAPLHSLLPRL